MLSKRFKLTKDLYQINKSELKPYNFFYTESEIDKLVQKTFNQGEVFYLDVQKGLLCNDNGNIDVSNGIDENLFKDFGKPKSIEVVHTPTASGLKVVYTTDNEYEIAIEKIMEFVWAVFKQYKDIKQLYPPVIESYLDGFVLTCGGQPASTKTYLDVLNNLYK